MSAARNQKDAQLLLLEYSFRKLGQIQKETWKLLITNVIHFSRDDGLIKELKNIRRRLSFRCRMKTAMALVKAIAESSENHSEAEGGLLWRYCIETAEMNGTMGRRVAATWSKEPGDE